MTVSLAALLTGTVKPFGPRGEPSGIDKHPVSGAVDLLWNGFRCDAQGDRRFHGGPDKAVHHYPYEHYRAWQGEIGFGTALERPGAFGENLSTVGITEADVALGDVFRLGGAVVAVSQGRQPCWKLNCRFGVPDMARRVQVSGRTGWYYRVLEEGRVAVGDTLVCLDRPTPDWPLFRLWQILYEKVLDYHELAAMATLPNLPENWRRIAERRLANRCVEDWRLRLDGEAASND